MATLRKSMAATSHHCCKLIRSFSSKPKDPLLSSQPFGSDPHDFFGDTIKPDTNSFESADDFEKRLFGSSSPTAGSDGAFFRKLDRIDRVRGSSSSPPGGGFGSGSGFGFGFGTGSGMSGGGGGGGFLEGFDTLADGMDDKLKKAAAAFPTTDEIYNEDYAFRPDVTFEPGMTYTPRDLDLTKPGVRKDFRRPEFETTTAEVLKKADFRNVRFLANFLTEAGIIIKRSQTKISAKAQRKVAREIKTARALGLMPFTTMGTKRFNFGKSAKEEDADYEYYDSYYDRTVPDAAVEPEEVS